MSKPPIEYRAKKKTVESSKPTKAQLARLAELEAKAAKTRERVKLAVRRFRSKKKQNGETK